MNTFDELREAAKARFEDTLRKIDEAESLVSDIARNNGLAPTPALTTQPAAKKTRGRPSKHAKATAPMKLTTAIRNWIAENGHKPFKAVDIRNDLRRLHPKLNVSSLGGNLNYMATTGELKSEGKSKWRTFVKPGVSNAPPAPMPMVLNEPMNRAHGSALKQGMREALKTLDGEFNREDLRAAVLKVAPAALEHEKAGAFASTLAELRESCEIELVGRPSPESPAVYKRGITKEGR